MPAHPERFHEHPYPPYQSLLKEAPLCLQADCLQGEVELIEHSAGAFPVELIGNLLGIPADSREPLRDWLLAKPDLITTAVDEFLRMESPNQFGNRLTTEDITLHGTPIPAGSDLYLCIGAANRDPAQFDDPDTLHLDRRPNKHHAFAGGAHTCVGATLARMEGRIAVGRFLHRFPNYALMTGAKRAGRIRFRGFERLPAILN
jgi:cytochrome P450